MTTRNLAIRRNDLDAAEEIGRQIEALGGDPATGQVVDVPGGAQEDADARIQRINENNRKKTKEAMANAHMAEVRRKRAEEAIVKAKQCVRSPYGLVREVVAGLPDR